jgi:hypothetical protein
MLIRNQRAFASGVLFLVVSVFYFVMSFNYATGTAARMGPGFFPRMVAVLFGLIAIGVIFGAMSPRAKREDLERWDIKGLLWIAGSVVLFAVLLPIFRTGRRALSSDHRRQSREPGIHVEGRARQHHGAEHLLYRRLHLRDQLAVSRLAQCGSGKRESSQWICLTISPSALAPPSS